MALNESMISRQSNAFNIRFVQTRSHPAFCGISITFEVIFSVSNKKSNKKWTRREMGKWSVPERNNSSPIASIDWFMDSDKKPTMKKVMRSTVNSKLQYQ